MTRKSEAYDLMPAAIAVQIPRLYATEKVNDPIVWVKYFTPDTSWSWFVTEYDPQDRLCFGYVIGHDKELGYFSLDEMEQARGPLGLPIERDLFWTPTPLTAIEKGEVR